MKRADRLGASYVLILGDKELAEGAAILRNMATKEQVLLPIDDMVEKIKKRFGSKP
jgi:histidyl-tRNA synthetase